MLEFYGSADGQPGARLAGSNGGQLLWTGGTLTGELTLANTARALIRQSGDPARQTGAVGLSQATLNNQGLINWEGGFDINAVQSTFNNQTGATFNASATGIFFNSFSDPDNHFINGGTLNLGSPLGVLQTSSNGLARFTNTETGVINLDAAETDEDFFQSQQGLALLDRELTQIIDRVGFAGNEANLYIEGAALSVAAQDAPAGQFSYVRKLSGGKPQDTDNNGADFLLVSTDATDGATAALGAPGPENIASPVQRNNLIKASLVDPTCAGFGAATSACARVRSGAGANPTTAAFGTLDLRRKFTNSTGASISKLRFRVADITTLNSPGATPSHADLRLLSSGDITANNDTITITGTTLDAPAQAAGGGHNSSVEAALPGGSLANGASVNVRFLLGVMKDGGFRFFVNVEAVTTTPSPREANQPDTRKRATRKEGGMRTR